MRPTQLDRFSLDLLLGLHDLPFLWLCMFPLLTAIILHTYIYIYMYICHIYCSYPITKLCHKAPLINGYILNWVVWGCFHISQYELSILTIFTVYFNSIWIAVIVVKCILQHFMRHMPEYVIWHAVITYQVKTTIFHDISDFTFGSICRRCLCHWNRKWVPIGAHRLCPLYTSYTHCPKLYDKSGNNSDEAFQQHIWPLKSENS